jgi:hypothetical protein
VDESEYQEWKSADGSDGQQMKALEWISAHWSVGVMMEEPGMEAGEWKEESMMKDKPRNGECYFLTIFLHAW